MTETPPDANDDPQKPTLMDRGKKVIQTAERTASVADTANTAFGAIKWIAIAVVTVTLAGGAFVAYKAVSAPAKAVGNAAGAVTESVKSGAGKIKDSGANVMNRLDIPSTNQTALNAASEAAFTALTTMAETEPEGVKDRIYRRTNFGGHENRVCKLTVETGTVSIPVTLAADNDDHATAKALGSNDNRLIRMVLTAGDDDIALRAKNWDELWTPKRLGLMRWKGNNPKKPPLKSSS